jgi:hypothetical protein
MHVREGLAAAFLCLPLPVAAQGLVTPSASIEATTDDRRRGLGWSGGGATLIVDAAVPIGEHFQIDAAAGLRGSRRHGGADLGVDAGARWLGEVAGWRLRAGGVGHVFDRGGLTYGEAQAGAAYSLGPATLDLAAAYAPTQRAIGGDNLYLSAGLDAGIPATPVTLYAGVGRTIGGSNGDPRARRLRPDGDYWDYRLGADYVLGPATAGLRLTLTSIDEDRVPRGAFTDRNVGEVLSGYVRFGF